MNLFKKNKGSVDGIIRAIESKTGCKVVDYKAHGMQFSDSSLGLPKPGENYMQVITPGYVINVKLDDGSRKVYHSNRNGNLLKEKV